VKSNDYSYSVFLFLTETSPVGAVMKRENLSAKYLKLTIAPLALHSFLEWQREQF
jgi:hypothetical protein